MLRTRHVSANVIPTTASTSKIITTERCIVLINFIGVPSGGMPSIYTLIGMYIVLLIFLPGQTIVRFLAM